MSLCLQTIFMRSGKPVRFNDNRITGEAGFNFIVYKTFIDGGSGKALRFNLI